MRKFISTIKVSGKATPIDEFVDEEFFKRLTGVSRKIFLIGVLPILKCRLG